MPDYSKGKVYVLRSHSTDKVYIGSTIETLSSRMSKHRYGFKHNNGVTSSEILKYNDCYIELICDYPCDRKEQLEKKEGEIIRQYKDKCVNRCIAGRSVKEWIEDNKEEHREQMKQYRENNKEILTENKKLWYNNNKERILDKRKQRYNDNKEQIAQKEKNKPKYTCECGSIMTSNHKSRHIKTTKHINFINSSN